MKTLTSLCAICMIIACICFYKAGQPNIIKENTDERGLTSVIFVAGKDTVAYDYLTEREYIKFINTGKPY